VVTDVGGSHAVQYGFDAVAIAVVDEGGTGRAAHCRQTVFGIVPERIATLISMIDLITTVAPETLLEVNPSHCHSRNDCTHDQSHTY